jgi:hypothetical protein
MPAAREKEAVDMLVRQVVTGHDAGGRAVFVRDEQVDGTAIPGIGELVFLWNADGPATYPDAGENPAAPAMLPPVGGIRFRIASYSPGGVVAPTTPRPGMQVGDEPGRVRTDTTEFGVLLSGELSIELDDGAEVVLSPGDVLVQNGTRHIRRVVGDDPATFVAFFIGAHRRWPQADPVA